MLSNYSCATGERCKKSLVLGFYIELVYERVKAVVALHNTSPTRRPC